MTTFAKSQAVSAASQIKALDSVISHAGGCMKAIHGHTKGSDLFREHVEAAANSIRWMDANRQLISEVMRQLSSRAA